jgi:hypothetical protein
MILLNRLKYYSINNLPFIQQNNSALVIIINLTNNLH